MADRGSLTQYRWKKNIIVCLVIRGVPTVRRV